MLGNEVIVSEVDKKEALYHINEVNKILRKYPYNSCFANSVTALSRAKTYSKKHPNGLDIYIHLLRKNIQQIVVSN